MVLVEYFDMNDLAVRQQHDRLARVYDRRWSRYISRTLVLLKTWASIPPQAAVLDIGCGTGEFERLVLSEQPEQRMVGVDLSVKMLEIAREKCQAYPNVTFAPPVPRPYHFQTIALIWLYRRARCTISISRKRACEKCGASRIAPGRAVIRLCRVL